MLFQHARRLLAAAKLSYQPAVSLTFASSLAAGYSRLALLKEKLANPEQVETKSLHNEGPLQSFGTAAAKKVFIETYGCQMNVSDTEVVLSILKDHNYGQANSVEDADVVLLNTCAIRENAEGRIWGRLTTLAGAKRFRRKEPHRAPLVVGLLGCMAERLRERLLDKEKLADIVAGPDAYRDLPRLIDLVQGGSESAINTQLSHEETYADITPVRQANAVSAFVSIMRGCNNMCAFCIVPFTRGRERSRPALSVLDEVRQLSAAGVREVTLLGQNVNSYADFSERGGEEEPSTSGRSDPYAEYARGFRSVYRPKRTHAVSFAELLSRVAEVDPEMRIRFTSPHPKDFSDEVLKVIAQYPNVCKQLHMPAQSGSSSVLDRMKRGYTREAYDALVARARLLVPGVALSTDMIVGFCGETEAEHEQSLQLLEQTGFDNAFIFAYSERAKTYASRHLPDDVPQHVKDRRLQEMLAVFKRTQEERSRAEVGETHLVLLEGPAKRPERHLLGKTCTMKKVVLPDEMVPPSLAAAWAATAPRTRSAGSSTGAEAVRLRPGDYVAVRVVGTSHSTLIAEPIARSSIREFTAARRTEEDDGFDDDFTLFTRHDRDDAHRARHDRGHAHSAGHDRGDVHSAGPDWDYAHSAGHD